MATITKGKTFVNGELVTPEKLHQLVDSATVTNIANADIAAGAAIADTKLAQITTPGKVANSATTATNANTANAIVARDSSGNFSAATITANLTGNVTGNAATATTATTATNALACSGNAATATKLATARTINGVAFDGTANITLATGVTSTVAISQGGTGSTTAAGALTNLGAAASSHTHDDRYYTESEMNTLLAGKQASGSYATANHTHSAEGITSGTLANARTTATWQNTPNAIVARDTNGGISISDIMAISYGGNSGILSVFNSLLQGAAYIGGILSNSTNTGVIYSTGSDYRLKTNFEPLNGALARLLRLPVYRFHFVGHTSSQKIDGFIAHEAQAVVPEAVTGTKDAVDADGKPIYQGIDQSKLVPLLVAAVQELSARVAALEAK